MTYFHHWKLNMIVAGKALLLFLFHFIHAFIPTKWTDHHWLGLNLNKPISNTEKAYIRCSIILKILNKHHDWYFKNKQFSFSSDIDTRTEKYEKAINKLKNKLFEENWKKEMEMFVEEIFSSPEKLNWFLDITKFDKYHEFPREKYFDILRRE